MSASKTPGSVAYFDAGATQYEKTSGDCTKDLARTVVQHSRFASMYAPDVVVLDNAAGPGIVTEEIVYHARLNQLPIPVFRIAEPAPKMIELAEAKLAALALEEGVATTHVTLGEELEFADNTFTHSITNLGLMFFNDGLKGVKEVYRTLKPGGVAALTCWSYMGYIDGVVRPAQATARPNDPPYQIPLPTDWFQPVYVAKSMTDAGFDNVFLDEVDAHFGTPTVEELNTLLEYLFTYLYKDWSPEEQEKFKAAMRENVAKVAEPYTMLDGKPGFGIPMQAIIATGEK